MDSEATDLGRDYKKAALESLKRLEGLTMAGTDERKRIETLTAQVKKETDPAMCWRYYQSLRELIAEGEKGKAEAPFKMRGKDGKVREYKSLAELDAGRRNYV